MFMEEIVMTLTSLLTALSNNMNMTITLLDANGNAIISFNAAGYAGINADLGSRNVKMIKVENQNNISITLEEINGNNNDPNNG